MDYLHLANSCDTFLVFLGVDPRQARDKLSSFMSFFSDPNDEAMEMFSTAAAQYKTAKACMAPTSVLLYRFVLLSQDVSDHVVSLPDGLAGDTYKEAAACAIKAKSLGEAAGHFTNAGQAYQKIPDCDRTSTRPATAVSLAL